MRENKRNELKHEHDTEKKKKINRNPRSNLNVTI